MSGKWDRLYAKLIINFAKLAVKIPEYAAREPKMARKGDFRTLWHPLGAYDRRRMKWATLGIYSE